MVALGMREPLTDAELAATIDADKAHFSRTIKSLIEQKYVEFLPSPKHKLQRHLYLSKKGKKLVEAYTGDKNRALAEVVEDMTEEQARALQILAKFFINEKQVTAFHHVKIQKCDYDDLSWLVHHRDFLLDGEDNRRLYLVMNAMDLVEHLTQNVIKVQHSWLVSDWGKRIGGCVLSYERENIAIAWIKLLILPADRKVALKLLRACIASAETQGYEMIKYGTPKPSDYLSELLGELGFLRTNDTISGVFKPVRETFWERRLLPSLNLEQRQGVAV